jgi:hypothetical protein
MDRDSMASGRIFHMHDEPANVRLLERMVAEGFNGHLEEPIRYHAFLATVAALLGAGRAT